MNSARPCANLCWWDKGADTAWTSRLEAGPFFKRVGLSTRPVNVGLVLNKVQMCHVSSPPTFHAHISAILWLPSIYCKSTIYFRRHNNIMVYSLKFNITYIIILATCFDSYESFSGINFKNYCTYCFTVFCLTDKKL